MKKINFASLIIFIMMTALSVRAQPGDLELKMKILPERLLASRDVKVMIFHTASEIIKRDSIDLRGKRIIHFPPASVWVDYILDTIRVDSNYVKDTAQILEAYRFPGKILVLTNNSEKINKTRLGTCVHETICTDSTNFLYNAPSKEVRVWQKKEVVVKNHSNYWLVGAWLVFLFGLITYFIFEKAIKKAFDDIIEVRPVNSESHKHTAIVIIALIVWVIAVIRIIASPSILILLVIGAVGGLAYLLDKKDKEKAAKKKGV